MENILEIPAGYDTKKVNDWVGMTPGTEILEQEDNGGNYMVMVKNRVHLRVLRFFVMNDETHVSVDYDSSWTESNEVLFRVFKMVFGCNE